MARKAKKAALLDEKRMERCLARKVLYETSLLDERGCSKNEPSSLDYTPPAR
jgi:hypothetical protein